MSMADDVQLRAVTKTFGSFKAVAGIDLDVEHGQFVTLLGPSGCGKTTTLRMIGGFEAPDSGEIRVAGERVQPDGKRRHTRMVFQSYALFPHRTVVENVSFGLRMARVPSGEIRRRVDGMIGKLGLADQAVKYPRQLSGGQQQRVALARALVTEPRVLLLDEPLGALDLKMRKRMQNELKALQRDVGITFIYVTHDQEEAMNLSDRIVVMENGAIAQIGSPEDIYHRPATAYVADFIGEINLLPGQVVSLPGSNARIRTGLGELGGVVASGATFEPGAPVLVAVRPESILVGPDAAALPDARSGVLRMKAFLGSVTRAEINVSGTTITADYRGTLPVGVGEPIAFAWPDHAALVLKSPSVRR